MVVEESPLGPYLFRRVHALHDCAYVSPLNVRSNISIYPCSTHASHRVGGSLDIVVRRQARPGDGGPHVRVPFFSLLVFT